MMYNKDNNSFVYTDERFADLQMLRYRLEGFETLSLRQKIYIYYLAKAALSGRDIVTDQFGKYNLDIRKTLEAVYNSATDKQSCDFEAMTIYLKRVWFSNGIYHHYGCEKFKPEFSEKWFRSAVKAIDKTLLPLQNYKSVEDLLDTLCQVIFNPTFLPKRVNLAEGQDLVKTSACNFYEGVTLQEATTFYDNQRDPDCGDFQPSWGLNSKLIKRNGKLEEETYTANGLYGKAISQIIYWLSKAAEVTENEHQKEIIGILIDYYKSGDLRLFDKYSIEWLQEQKGDIDFINGFIEVYGDPLGLKGSWEGLVEYKDKEATQRTQTISANAQWFEDHSPVDIRFKKQKVRGVTANVICAAMLGGDEYPSSAIGINLPNADWIRARYGSKSVTISNLTDAYKKAAHGNGLLQEFVIDADTRRIIEQYGDLCDDLHTDLHECLGHGSGQLLPGVSPDSLKAYGSTIEEARADLFGLYYLPDQKLIDLKLVPDAEAYKSQYYTYMMNGLLTQLVRIKPGHQIEEAHMRNRAIIARWCLANSQGVVEIVKRDNKSFVKINDYLALRKCFGKLLAEVQRIKSEGDYAAARQLVEQYGVRIDPVMHEEILNRYSKLGIAPYKGFINPWLKPITDDHGQITDIVADYTETYEHQMLRYSSEYGLL